MNNLFDIRDYVVVITGGTGVLGRCIGKYLALNGAKVVLLGRKADVGAEIVADIQAEGGNAKFMKCDVMNQEMVQATCDAIVAEYGRVDTLLNAAGGNQKGATIGPEQNFFDLDPSQFPERTQSEPRRHRHPHPGVSQTDGGTRQGLDYQLLLYGSFPPADPRVWLCGCQGRHLQLHRIHGS